jgi:hypothetical protein
MNVFDYETVFTVNNKLLSEMTIALLSVSLSWKSEARVTKRSSEGTDTFDAIKRELKWPHYFNKNFHKGSSSIFLPL